ncbi:GtrA family protein [bacterium]|nr:GtrA family protein [bacterium]
MIVLNYVLFAVVATILNLFSQYCYLRFSPITFLMTPIAILLGTFVGLLAKYILDKLFIFKFEAIDKNEEVKTFAFYSFMGIFTTLIFWFFEGSFIYLFPESEYAMYLGAILGLSIGYVVKYFLDKKYVFKQR